MAHIFTGLDGEMTSADLRAGGRLIQIGLAVGTEPEERFCSLIGWDRGDFVADPTAMLVHGIPEEEIVAAPRPDRVDRDAEEWCLARGASEEKRAMVPVGWNVGAFDLPFVRQALPRTYRLLSRRTVDLNAVCFTLAGVAWLGGSQPRWTGWRRLAKREAEDRLTALGIEPAWHDAGYDALASLVSWRWLRENGLRGPDPGTGSG
jgi:hypothetical protein